MAKQRQTKMQNQVGALAAMDQLKDRSDDQLRSESKHRVAAKALLGARAAERYDAKTARAYFNEALAGCHPQERPALRQMMKASMALAERRANDLKDAVERLGQAPPSGRQLFMLRLMGLVMPSQNASTATRLRGAFLFVLLLVVILAIGFGIAMLIALPFGGVGIGFGVLLGLLIVIAVLGVLTLLGRRRQARAGAQRAGGG